MSTTQMYLDVTKTLLSAVAATGAGTSYVTPTKSNSITWQFVSTTNPASVTCVIQASLDGTNYDTIDTNTTTTGATRTVTCNATSIRANITALSGGGGISVYAICKAI